MTLTILRIVLTTALTMWCALEATACGGENGTMNALPDSAVPSDASSDDAASAADASTDAAPDAMPQVGTWSWALSRAQAGQVVRRSTWPVGYLVRHTGGKLERSSNGGSSWSVWTPLQDDYDATDWLQLGP